MPLGYAAGLYSLGYTRFLQLVFRRRGGHRPTLLPGPGRFFFRAGPNWSRTVPALDRARRRRMVAPGESTTRTPGVDAALEDH